MSEAVSPLTNDEIIYRNLCLTAMNSMLSDLDNFIKDLKKKDELLHLLESSDSDKRHKEKMEEIQALEKELNKMKDTIQLAHGYIKKPGDDFDQNFEELFKCYAKICKGNKAFREKIEEQIQQRTDKIGEDRLDGVSLDSEMGTNMQRFVIKIDTAIVNAKKNNQKAEKNATEAFTKEYNDYFQLRLKKLALPKQQPSEPLLPETLLLDLKTSEKEKLKNLDKINKSPEIRIVQSSFHPSDILENISAGIGKQSKISEYKPQYPKKQKNELYLMINALLYLVCKALRNNPELLQKIKGDPKSEFTKTEEETMLINAYFILSQLDAKLICEEGYISSHVEVAEKCATSLIPIINKLHKSDETLKVAQNDMQGKTAPHRASLKSMEDSRNFKKLQSDESITLSEIKEYKKHRDKSGAPRHQYGLQMKEDELQDITENKDKILRGHVERATTSHNKSYDKLVKLADYFLENSQESKSDGTFNGFSKSLRDKLDPPESIRNLFRSIFPILGESTAYEDYIEHIVSNLRESTVVSEEDIQGKDILEEYQTHGGVSKNRAQHLLKSSEFKTPEKFLRDDCLDKDGPFHDLFQGVEYTDDSTKPGEKPLPATSSSPSLSLSTNETQLPLSPLFNSDGNTSISKQFSYASLTSGGSTKSPLSDTPEVLSRQSTEQWENKTTGHHKETVSDTKKQHNDDNRLTTQSTTPRPPIN